MMLVLGLAAGPCFARPAADDDAGSARYTQPVSGTTLELEMVRVPGPTPVYFSRCEITWDLFDAFIYKLDEAAGSTAADAITRPSKPYISMDRGFGHSGFPAISMSAKGAEAFCAWLSAKTGRRYRLPTEVEWARACAASGITAENAGEHGWYRDNASYKTHQVDKKKADAAGLHDLWGNASEWCTTADGGHVTRGGSFRDALETLGCAGRVSAVPAWNASDPQFPKSVWWLADAGFVGFRVVCEDGPSQ